MANSLAHAHSVGTEKSLVSNGDISFSSSPHIGASIAPIISPSKPLSPEIRLSIPPKPNQFDPNPSLPSNLLKSLSDLPPSSNDSKIEDKSVEYEKDVKNQKSANDISLSKSPPLKLPYPLNKEDKFDYSKFPIKNYDINKSFWDAFSVGESLSVDEISATATDNHPLQERAQFLLVDLVSFIFASRRPIVPPNLSQDLARCIASIRVAVYLRWIHVSIPDAIIMKCKKEEKLIFKIYNSILQMKHKKFKAYIECLDAFDKEFSITYFLTPEDPPIQWCHEVVLVSCRRNFDLIIGNSSSSATKEEEATTHLNKKPHPNDPTEPLKPLSVESGSNEVIMISNSETPPINARSKINSVNIENYSEVPPDITMKTSEKESSADCKLKIPPNVSTELIKPLSVESGRDEDSSISNSETLPINTRSESNSEEHENHLNSPLKETDKLLETETKLPKKNFPQNSLIGPPGFIDENTKELTDVEVKFPKKKFPPNSLIGPPGKKYKRFEKFTEVEVKFPKKKFPPNSLIGPPGYIDEKTKKLIDVEVKFPKKKFPPNSLIGPPGKKHKKSRKSIEVEVKFPKKKFLPNSLIGPPGKKHKKSRKSIEGVRKILKEKFVANNPKGPPVFKVKFMKFYKERFGGQGCIAPNETLKNPPQFENNLNIVSYFTSHYHPFSNDVILLFLQLSLSIFNVISAHADSLPFLTQIDISIRFKESMLTCTGLTPLASHRDSNEMNFLEVSVIPNWHQILSFEWRQKVSLKCFTEELIHCFRTSDDFGLNRTGNNPLAVSESDEMKKLSMMMYSAKFTFLTKFRNNLPDCHRVKECYVTLCTSINLQPVYSKIRELILIIIVLIDEWMNFLKSFVLSEIMLGAQKVYRKSQIW